MMHDTWHAGSVPPNPRDKPGYLLEFADEFDGSGLDPEKWLPFHFPHWSSRASAAARYQLEEDCLVLEITRDQAPWCPEFDGSVRVSSLQTGVFSGPVGSAVGQLRFNPANRVRQAQAETRLYVPHYGYFEMRGRAVGSPLNHVALWMIGVEDVPERSGEICICEIMGGFVGEQSSRIGYGIHPWGDQALMDDFHDDFFPIDATCFHIYAAEWTPDHVDFFIDNRLVRRIAQSPAYPMQFMLGIYERPDNPLGVLDRQSGYPKRFAVDYFRAYRPLNGYRSEA